MQWSQWLQGGPFLEVSFLLELKEEKRKTAQDIIGRLSRIINKVEIVDKNVDEVISFFERGYPYDEDHPQTNYIHSLRLRLYIYIARKRKAVLQIEMVSSNAIMVGFWFYGDEFDVPEWDQIGIKKEEIEDFKYFIKELYSVYEFNIGGIAMEEDVLELFGFGEAYPNECYRYENLSPDSFLQGSSRFIDIISSKNTRN